MMMGIGKDRQLPGQGDLEIDENDLRGRFPNE